MRRGSILLFSCVSLVACAGILGLEEPTFVGNGADASETGATDGSTDGTSTTDAAPTCVPHGTEKLATGYGTVYDLVIDDEAVYFTSFDRFLLVRVKKDGSSLNELLPEGGVELPTGLRVQGAHVYWTAYGPGNFQDSRNGVRRMPKLGGVAESYDRCNTGFDLAVDEKYVYAVTAVCGDKPKVRRWIKEDRDAGFVESYRDTNVDTEFAYATYGWTGQDNDNLYWSSSKVIRRLEKSFLPDAAPTVVGDSPGGAIQDIKVDDRIYVLGEDALYAFDKNGSAKPITLADTLATPGARASIALDEKYVYFTESKAGFVKRIARNGKDVEVIAKDQALPSGIAVDACSVYWANAGDGTVWRSPKPKSASTGP